jgi:hypothetical protein
MRNSQDKETIFNVLFFLNLIDFIKINLLRCCVDGSTYKILKLKNIIFWDVTPCSPVEVLLFSRLSYLSIRATYGPLSRPMPITLLLDPTTYIWDPYRPTEFVHAADKSLRCSLPAGCLLELLTLLKPEDGASTFLRNIGERLPEYMALQSPSLRNSYGTKFQPLCREQGEKPWTVPSNDLLGTQENNLGRLKLVF